MRRMMIVAVVAIGALFAVSVALIAAVTGDDAPTSPHPAAAAAPVEVREPPPGILAPPQAPPPAPAAPFVLPAPAVTPVVSPQPEPPPPPPVVRDGARPEIDLGGSVPALEQRIGRRCGQMQVRAARTMPPEGAPETVLLLELSAAGQQLTVASSWVRSAGRTRPALVACAQWALRGAPVDAPAPRPGTYRVPVILSVDRPAQRPGADDDE